MIFGQVIGGEVGLKSPAYLPEYFFKMVVNLTFP